MSPPQSQALGHNARSVESLQNAQVSVIDPQNEMKVLCNSVTFDEKRVPEGTPLDEERRKKHEIEIDPRYRP